MNAGIRSVLSLLLITSLNAVELNHEGIFNEALLKAYSAPYGSVRSKLINGSKKTAIIIADIHNDVIMGINSFGFLYDLKRHLDIDEIFLEGYSGTHRKAFNFTDHVEHREKNRSKFSQRVLELLSYNQINPIEALFLLQDIKVLPTEDLKIYKEMKSLGSPKFEISTVNKPSVVEIENIRSRIKEISEIEKNWAFGNVDEQHVIQALRSFLLKTGAELFESSNALSESSINHVNANIAFFEYCHQRSMIIAKSVEGSKSKFPVFFVGRGHVNTMEKEFLKKNISFISFNPMGFTENRPGIINEPVTIVDDTFRERELYRVSASDFNPTRGVSSWYQKTFAKISVEAQSTPDVVAINNVSKAIDDYFSKILMFAPDHFRNDQYLTEKETIFNRKNNGLLVNVLPDFTAEQTLGDSDERRYRIDFHNAQNAIGVELKYVRKNSKGSLNYAFSEQSRRNLVKYITSNKVQSIIYIVLVQKELLQDSDLHEKMQEKISEFQKTILNEIPKGKVLRLQLNIVFRPKLKTSPLRGPIAKIY